MPKIDTWNYKWDDGDEELEDFERWLNEPFKDIPEALSNKNLGLKLPDLDKDIEEW